MQEFTQLGIAGATLAILFVIVRFFIQAMDKKDTYIQEITGKFSETVNTHLANENLAREKEMEALTQVLNLLDEHTKVLSNIVNYSMAIDGKMAEISKHTAKTKRSRQIKN